MSPRHGRTPRHDPARPPPPAGRRAPARSTHSGAPQRWPASTPMHDPGAGSPRRPGRGCSCHVPAVTPPTGIRPTSRSTGHPIAPPPDSRRPAPDGSGAPDPSAARRAAHRTVHRRSTSATSQRAVARRSIESSTVHDRHCIEPMFDRSTNKGRFDGSKWFGTHQRAVRPHSPDGGAGRRHPVVSSPIRLRRNRSPPEPGCSLPAVTGSNPRAQRRSPSPPQRIRRGALQDRPSTPRRTGTQPDRSLHRIRSAGGTTRVRGCRPASPASGPAGGACPSATGPGRRPCAPRRSAPRGAGGSGTAPRGSPR